MNDKAELLSQLKIERPPETASSQLNKWIIGLSVAGLVVVGAILLSWWWPQRAATVVTVEQVLRPPSQQSASVLDASGYVAARRIATVSSKVTGKVVAVMVEEGMQVSEGQILAELDDASTRAEFNLAAAQLQATRRSLQEIEIQLEQARRNLVRSQELNTRGLASEADLEVAATAVDGLQARLAARREDVVVAQQSVALQQQRLDDAVIRAPFAGVVIAKAAQPGEMISPISAGGGFTRTGICTIVDMSSLEIEVDVNEAYIQRVQTGQSVTATLDAYPDWKIPANVIAIVPTADRQKATVRVRIGFNQLESRILPDMGVKVAFHSDAQIETSTTAPGLSISASALRREGDVDIVYIVRDGRVHRHAVTSGGRLNDKVIVVSGLSAGDIVVRDIPEGLRNGDPVVVK